MPHSSLAGRRAAIAFIFVTAVLDIVAMGIVIPVLPALIEQFTGSNARAGVINGVFVALWAGMQFIASPSSARCRTAMDGGPSYWSPRSASPPITC